MGAAHPTAAGNPQSMNASNFATNAQIPSPGLVMPPIPPHPFPQELFKQLVNSSLPPPPPPSFPPVPIPNLGFSPYQPPPNLANNFTPPQNHNPGNLTGNTGNLLQNPGGSQPVFETPSEPIVGSREEGELSDGELEEHSATDSFQTVSQEEAGKKQISSPHKSYSTLETQGPSGTSVYPTSPRVILNEYPAEMLTRCSGPSARSFPPPTLNSGSAGQKATDFVQSHRPVQNHPHYNADMGNVLQGQRKTIPEMTPLSREDSGSCNFPCPP
jgi:hypothetical protein